MSGAVCWLLCSCCAGCCCDAAAHPRHPHCSPSFAVPLPQKHLIKLLLRGEEVPPKVAETGRGYTLSGERQKRGWVGEWMGVGCRQLGGWVDAW